MKAVQYTVRVPAAVDKAMQKLAAQQNVTPYEMLQRCVKAGVTALTNPPTHGANDRELVTELASISTGVAHVERMLDRALFTACASYYNHNIAFLRSLAEGLDRRLYGIWPEGAHRERSMFQKLKEAYTKARYSKHFKITEVELTWLGERVEELGRVVHQVCSDKIAELEAAARK